MHTQIKDIGQMFPVGNLKMQAKFKIMFNHLILLQHIMTIQLLIVYSGATQTYLHFLIIFNKDKLNNIITIKRCLTNSFYNYKNSYHNTFLLAHEMVRLSFYRLLNQIHQNRL